MSAIEFKIRHLCESHGSIVFSKSEDSSTSSDTYIMRIRVGGTWKEENISLIGIEGLIDQLHQELHDNE